MIQHPIPQNVTGYQFRLIGDMTIKQFMILAFGIGAAITFYYTNLFFFIKWFLILISAMGGFAVAFLPLEERPLDQWVVNYIRAIYRPTFFVWQKIPKSPDFFSFTPNQNTNTAADIDEISKIAAIRRQQGLHSYLTTLPNDHQNDIDLRENASAQNALSLFSLGTAAIPMQPAPSAIGAPVAQVNINVDTAAPPVSPTTEVESTEKSNQESQSSSNSPQGVVNQNTVSIRNQRSAAEEKTMESSTPSAPAEAQPLSQTIATQTEAPATAATTSADLPFPSTPTTPNTLVGMVIDAQEKIISNAIVEVVDETGMPVRATKTNQLGQFFSTTPLRRGTYRLNVDKPGHNFDTIELALTGQIVNPLKIQAKA